MVIVVVAILAALTGPAKAEYVGQLSSNQFLYDSTSNQFGPYGSPFSYNSINNQFGPYGSPFSNQSVNNPFASDPPSVGDDGGLNGE